MTPIIIRKNKFGECQYNGTPCYYVEHIPSGGRTIFDHDRFLLNNLIEIVGTDGGALHWSGGSMKFRDGSPLRGYLLAEYRNVPYAFVKSKYVHLKQSSGENSIENCTSDNLYHSNEAVQTLGNRKIMRVGDCLKIAVKKKEETQWIYDYTEYDPDLFEILARTDIFSPWLLETKSGYRTYTEIRYGHE